MRWATVWTGCRRRGARLSECLGGRGISSCQSWASRPSFVDVAIFLFLLLAFVKAFHDLRAPWYQRGLIRKPLRKIGVILLHHVEQSFRGELRWYSASNLCMAASCSSVMILLRSAVLQQDEHQIDSDANRNRHADGDTAMNGDLGPASICRDQARPPIPPMGHAENNSGTEPGFKRGEADSFRDALSHGPKIIDPSPASGFPNDGPSDPD